MTCASELNNFIEVKKQKLKGTDLQVNIFIIFPVEDFHGNVFNYPAQITKLGNNGEIHIDYLKQDFDKKEVLLKPYSETSREINS